MRDAQGSALRSSEDSLEPSDSPILEQDALLANPQSDAKAVAVPCIDNPAKDCILCSEFDECSFNDRRSSLNSVAFALIFTMLITAAIVSWLLLH